MKHIIKISEVLGPELRTRQLIENWAITLNPMDEYLINMDGVVFVSRSAADELYNAAHDYHVEFVGMATFVQKMYDAVTLGRFQPRQLRPSSTPIVYCKNMKDVDAFLNAI